MCFPDLRWPLAEVVQVMTNGFVRNQTAWADPTRTQLSKKYQLMILLT